MLTHRRLRYEDPASTEKREDALSVKTGYTRASKAVEKRESNLDDAFYWWNLFYNNEFPSR
jgi:hypothetical protein